MECNTGLAPKNKRCRVLITMEEGLAAAAEGNFDLSGWVKLEAKSETASVFPAEPAKAKRKSRQLPFAAAARDRARHLAITLRVGTNHTQNCSDDEMPIRGSLFRATTAT